MKTTSGVSKGVGVTETEGQPSKVLKGYFATFATHLARSSTVRRTDRPESTRAEIVEHTDMDDLDASAGQLGGHDPWNGRLGPGLQRGRDGTAGRCCGGAGREERRGVRQ